MVYVITAVIPFAGFIAVIPFVIPNVIRLGRRWEKQHLRLWLQETANTLPKSATVYLFTAASAWPHRVKLTPDVAHEPSGSVQVRRRRDALRWRWPNESFVTEQGVASFEYSPASEAQPLLFELARPLDDLEVMMLDTFAGRSMKMGDRKAPRSPSAFLLLSNPYGAVVSFRATNLIVRVVECCRFKFSLNFT